MELFFGLLLQPVPMSEPEGATAAAGVLGHMAAQLDALVEHAQGNAERVIDLLDLAVQHLFRTETVPGMAAVLLDRGALNLAQGAAAFRAGQRKRLLELVDFHARLTSNRRTLHRKLHRR